MRKIVLAGIALVFLLASLFSVYTDDMNLRSVDTILAEIQQEKGVQIPEEIAADKVSQEKPEGYYEEYATTNTRRR